MDISVIRHAERAADRACSIAVRAWRWLIARSAAYPQPPYPNDANIRGLGWSGREYVRPFEPPEPPLLPPMQLDHLTVHENIDARSPEQRRREAEAGRPPSDLGLGLGQFGRLGGPAVVGVPLIWPAGNPEDPE